MRQWEPQPLPGILEGLPPVSVPMPSEALAGVTEALKQLREVDVPDWLDGDPLKTELHAMFITLDTWTILIDMMRGQLIKKAVIDG